MKRYRNTTIDGEAATMFLLDYEAFNGTTNHWAQLWSCSNNSKAYENYKGKWIPFTGCPGQDMAIPKRAA